MIKLEDLKKTIIALLKSQGLKTYDNGIKQGYKRPCFFVQLMPIKSNLSTINYSENEVTVEIVYFSENESDLENIKMYDTLYSIFSKPIDVNGRKRLPTDIRTSIDDDDNMSFRFDIEYWNEAPKEEVNTEIMETLNVNFQGGIK